MIYSVKGQHHRVMSQEFGWAYTAVGGPLWRHLGTGGNMPLFRAVANPLLRRNADVGIEHLAYAGILPMKRRKYFDATDSCSLEVGTVPVSLSKRWLLSVQNIRVIFLRPIF